MSVAVHKYIAGGGSVNIARSIEEAILSGRLEPGARLPTVRALARSLSVAPATVAAAYRSLRQRGLLSGQGRRGTTVSAAPPLAPRLQLHIPEGVRNLADGNPDQDLLPDLAAALSKVDPSPRLYSDRLKSPELLEKAARHLQRDGVAVEHLTVVSGALDGIERVLQSRLRPGDRVVVEDPAFPSITDLVAALGLVAVPVVVDERGILPEALEYALASGAEAVIVTPRAHNPTGAAMSGERAKLLRRVLATKPEVLVIEDDHAAGVAGAALHTLCDRRRGRWALTRSVSKSLGPDLRLAVMAGDGETIARVEGRQLMGMRWVSHVLQDLVAALWSDKRVIRGLASAEAVYSKRRQGLLEELAARGIQAYGSSGLNVWIPVSEETSAVQRLRDAGWAVAAGERFRLGTPPAIRVTTSTLEPCEARSFAAAMSSAMAIGVGSAAV